MSKRINWEEFSKKQRIQRQGSEFGFDEFYPTGSFADQRRFFLKEQSDRSKAQPIENPKRNRKKSRRKTNKVNQTPKPTIDLIPDFIDRLKTLVSIIESNEWQKKDRRQKQPIVVELDKKLRLILIYKPELEKNNSYCIKAANLLKDPNFRNLMMNPSLFEGS